MSDRGLIANILINAANEYWPFTRFRKELEFKKTPLESRNPLTGARINFNIILSSS